MSLAMSLLDIITDEMAKAKANHLLSVRVRYGVLSQVIPESLQTAFEVITVGTPLEGAKMELEEEAAIFLCRRCGQQFSPPDRKRLFMPCPGCGNETGHKVLAGKGLYLDQIEVED